MPLPYNHLRTVIIIPARYGSKRLPGKPLIDLCGKSMISRTYASCVLALDKTNVYVATDDDRIQKHCEKNNMNVIMTSRNCMTGTDRVYEASRKIDAHIYINVQGDEPLIDPKDIQAIMEASKRSPQQVFCAMLPFHNEDDFKSPSIVKVVTKLSNELLYASRAPIPINKLLSFAMAKKQVGLYAFPKQALNDFVHIAAKTPLEEKEDIEILRFLELGHKVQMVEMLIPSISVDTSKDIGKVEEILCRREILTS